MARQPFPNSQDSEYAETVVAIKRTAAVVKGGRRFSFSALVVVGDKKGRVGFGYGKAREVAEAIRKGSAEAKKKMVKIPMRDDTIPHEIVGKFGATRVKLIPAGPGTGVIAGAAARAVLGNAGIVNILTKVHGSTNPMNVVKATMNGLLNLRTREQVAKLRGVKI
ncbi:MAG: 30S ribosomal protein S5 [Planctomycetota bacterium]|nr:MAG: 30S ribosomal protein S5 [Planctomycetota bacterium]